MTTGLRIGSVVDRYEIVKHVARGGMGTVWLARFAGKHGFSKQVALKTIAPEFAQNPQSTAMFLEEARISSKLAHANVAQVLDVGEHGETVYIVFEWVEGRSLEELCRAATTAGQRVPVAFALRVLADACAGLHAAHELADDNGQPLDIVHRDVTPSNILVSENGFAKVIDFGIAKGRDRVLAETRGGFVKGTPQYMSPEQAFKEPVDRRSDVWSLGAVLYRSLSSGPPFPDHAALLAYVDGVSLLPELPRDVSADVLAIIARALTVRAKDRFGSAEEMRRAIERALHGGAADTPSAEGDGSPRVPTTKRDKPEPARAAEVTAQALAMGGAMPPALGQATDAQPPPAAPLPSTLMSPAARTTPTAPAAPAKRWRMAMAFVVLVALAALFGIAMMLLRR